MGEKGTHLRERLLVLCERRRQPRLLSLQLGPPRQERLKHRPRLVACHARQQLALLASLARLERASCATAAVAGARPQLLRLPLQQQQLRLGQ